MTDSSKIGGGADTSSEEASLVDSEEKVAPEKTAGIGFWHKLLQLDDTPESIALGAAVGMFIAWTPTVGIQMVIVILLALVIPMNRLAALIVIYISNPLTMIPMYYLEYLLGLQILGGQGMNYDEFLVFFNEILEIANRETFWTATKVFLEQLGYPVLKALTVGGALLGILTAIPTYPLTLKWVKGYRNSRRKANDASPL
ncbi:MAG: DUF2062 domain-containing protein [Planctomycetota bacterium]